MSQAQEQWARARPWIIEALAYTGGMYDIEDIERSIEDGSMVFMPGEHSALVLEIAIYPNGKALNVFAGGGEKGKTLREYIEKFEACVQAFAKANDCRWVTHFCRKSGERIGKRLGYRHQWSVMVKEVQ